jgi:D-psicose/D-tagatose/L-ribulose 3-epimerase
MPRAPLLLAFGAISGLVVLAPSSTVGIAAQATGQPAVGSVVVPPRVPGFPVGWCIRAKREVFADAKAAGFEYVELALQDVLDLTEEDFATLVADVGATGLGALSGYNPIPKELRLVGPDADQTKQDAHLQHLMARAHTLGLTYLIFNSGAAWRMPEGMSAEEGMSQLTAFSRRLTAAASASGITVLVEPLRGTDSNLITTVSEALSLVNAVNHARFKMMVDYSFLTIQNENPTVLLAAGPHLRHVHLANPANKRTYPMDAAESDYASFFRVLKQIGYRGGLSVHASTSSFATDAPRAIRFLRTEARGLAGR